MNRKTFLLVALLIPALNVGAAERVATVEATPGSLTLYPQVAYAQLELTIAGNAIYWQKKYGPGEAATFTTFDKTLPDGQYRFELIQTEAVSARRKPITLRAAVYDGPHAVTSVVTVTFDSTSDSIDDRKRTIRLELSTGEYDKSKPYRLVLRDADTDAEVQSVAVVIDRSFDDDF